MMLAHVASATKDIRTRIATPSLIAPYTRVSGRWKHSIDKSTVKVKV